MLFRSTYDKPLDFPKGKKIAGFYGSIASWIDVESLTYAASNLPDWQFVFIGDVKTDVSDLAELDNTHFLGRKAHEELPKYVSNWDISLISFKQNGQIEACNPLKLREYLAAGKPIVSTKFPAAEEYKDIINITKTHQEFVEKISDSYQSDIRKKSIAAVQNESWESRAKNLSELILKLPASPKKQTKLKSFLDRKSVV